MKKEVINPFATSELRIPEESWNDVRKFTSTFKPEEGAEPDLDRAPFRRYVDLWWAGLLIGINEGKRVENPPGGWHKFIDGVVLGTDPWRVFQLQLLGMAWKGDSSILAEPNRIIGIANEYAAHGIHVLLGVMVGQTEPVWPLGKELRERCTKVEGSVAAPAVPEEA